MPYFARLIQYTGMIFRQANRLEPASGHAAPQPESVPVLEVEEVRDIDTTDQAQPVDEADHPAPPPVFQPTQADAPPPVPQEQPVGAEPDGVLHRPAATPLTGALPVPQAPAASQEQLAPPPPRDTEAPVIAVSEIVEGGPTVLAPAPAATPPPRTGHSAEPAHPESDARQAVTRPVSAPPPQALLPSLAEVLTWVAATPAGGDQEPPPGARAAMAAGTEAMPAPWHHPVPLLTRPALAPTPAAEPSQHFSLHIGTIQLTIEEPPQPAVDSTPAPVSPARPQPTPAPTSQTSRWRRHYMRM
jgi:hypothetical protein